MINKVHTHTHSSRIIKVYLINKMQVHETICTIANIISGDNFAQVTQPKQNHISGSKIKRTIHGRIKEAWEDSRP